MDARPKPWAVWGWAGLLLALCLNPGVRLRAAEPAPAPAPAPALAAPDPQAEEARRLLAQRAAEEARQREENKTEVAARFKAGQEAFQASQYPVAREQLQRALALDQTHEEARKLLNRVNDILGQREGQMQQALQSVGEASRFAVEERLAALQSMIDWGNRYLQEAKTPELSLAERVRKYERAVQSFEKAKEHLKWLPSQLPGLEEQQNAVQRSLAEAQSAILSAQKDLEREDLEKAQKLAEERRLAQVERQQHQRDMILDQVKALYETGQYENAEKLAGKILEEDPSNAEAHAVEAAARSRKHQLAQRFNSEERRNELDKTTDFANKLTVPHQEYLIYPANWKEISQRQVDFQGQRAEDPWKQEVRRKFAKHVNFEFVDTPLQEALQFLNAMTKVTMILDPQVMTEGGDKIKITLKVSDMDIETALRWILRLADLDFDIRNQAIFITRKNKLVSQVEMEIYDIRDLTTNVTQFQSPIDAMVYGSAGTGTLSLTTATPLPTLSSQDLATLIKTNLLPQDFLDPTTTIDAPPNQGKLVVMQRPETHDKIKRILRSFRETQTVQVLTQIRFIDVTEGFLEQIGVNIMGLDSAMGQALEPRAGMPKRMLYPAGGGPGPGAANGPSSDMPIILRGDKWESIQYRKGYVNDDEFPFTDIGLQQIRRVQYQPLPGTGQTVAFQPNAYQILNGYSQGGILGPRLDGDYRDFIRPSGTDGVQYPHSVGGPVGARTQVNSSNSPTLLQGLTSNLVNTLQGSGPLGGALTNGLGLAQGATWQFRILGAIQASAVASALRKEQNTDVLFAPRLTQFNNQRSYILVANQSSYTSNIVPQGDNYNPETSVLTEGVLLDLKPTVSHDRKYVTLEIQQVVSTKISSETSRMTGYTNNNLVYNTGTTTNPNGTTSTTSTVSPVNNIDMSFDLPTVEMRVMRTTVTVPDQGTLLFSGLIHEKKIDSKTGVPFFSDLPVVGRLFCTNGKQRERRNLLVMVNSRIILFDEEEEKL